jgi:hypothetical protein
MSIEVTSMLINNYEHKLLIVDIQKDYAQYFNNEYLFKVYKFIKSSNFMDVRVLIDIFEDTYLGDYIPSFINEELTGEPIFKQYSSDLPSKLLEKDGINELEIKQELLKHNSVMPFQRGLLVLVEPWYIPNFKYSETNILDYYFLEYIPPTFKEYLDSCKEAKVHILGGGYGECVNITKKILDLLNIPNRIHSSYCYEMSPYSSLSYPPLEAKSKNNKYQEILNKQTQSIDWTFKENINFKFKG